MAVFAHHYLFDAASMLDDCIDKLQKTIDQDLKGHYYALYDMKEVLVSTEHLLHRYLVQILEIEKKDHGRKNATATAHREAASTSIMGTMTELKETLKEKQRQKEELHRRKIHFRNPQDPVSVQKNSLYNSGRSATDTLLFRLIVALQLCLVRIGDAHVVLTGRRIGVSTQDGEQNLGRRILILTGCCLIGAGVSLRDHQQLGGRKLQQLSTGIENQKIALGTLAKIGTALAIGAWVKSKINTMWVTEKIIQSSNEVEEWVKQWQVVQSTVSPGEKVDQLRMPGQRTYIKPTTELQPSGLLDEKSRRLIEYAMKHGPKPNHFWQTQGEVRFMMLKRFMDVYYASVGTAIDTHQTSAWQLPLMTGAAASFYSLTGASQKASQAVNTASRDLIQHAWGMVSLPAIKSLMLQASKLLKGASVADRIVICGVPCFILSREPAPELAAALKRRSRKSSISSMSTIEESEEHSESPSKIPKQFAGSTGRYRQRDVVFHLTGGGFFAHTIASDLPYLLDWSAFTGAVVICPEYALLPEHTFPVALDQIVNVYSALVDGNAVTDLGFEVNRVVVSGESSGGNLAAALCVKLGMQQILLEEGTNSQVAEESSVETPTTSSTSSDDFTRLPDALMLSCAALNLSLELSYSRVLGTQDPVLPSGLISAISDAYVPSNFSKQDPLASPFFAPDSVLQIFPPTLLFAGSNDPLLDDSVLFNERLRCLGVSSELRAVPNMPHAYLGLGTAGFPEAQQVQKECQEWISRQLRG